MCLMTCCMLLERLCALLRRALCVVQSNRVTESFDFDGPYHG